MTTYKLKPLAVDAFTWTGQPRASWPDWFSAVILGIVSDGACLIVAKTDSAFIVRVNDTLVRGATGEVYSLDPAAFASQIDAVLDVVATPTQTPAVLPWPSQPFEPIDHVTTDGVEYVRYYASPKGGGPLQQMPLTAWQELNPATADGLH